MDNTSKDSQLDLKDMRKPYDSETFSAILKYKEPFGLFKDWFDYAHQTPTIQEPNAMVVATSSKSGFPSARYVLLKYFNTDGFVFFTNYNSRKGTEIQENPNVALLFYWDVLHRQVRIEGTAVKTTVEESDKYFHMRPFQSQVSASVSPQSEPVNDREELIEKHINMEREYEGKEIPCPNYWGGFRVVPKSFEFWQGQSNRLHHRVVFKQSSEEQSEGDGWVNHVLAP